MVSRISPPVAHSNPRVGKAHRRDAFTLIELLVSMVIGLLLIVFLFQLFNSTVTAWRAGENQNDTYREARAAMQLMARDISQTSAGFAWTAFPSPTPYATPPIGGTAPVLVIDRYPNPDPPLQDDDKINEELYCLTNIPNNGASSLCAVGYFCMWMPDLIPSNDPQVTQKRARAPQAYALVRQFLGSGGTIPASTPASGGGPTPVPTPPGLAERFAAASVNPVLSFINVYERARPPLIPVPTPQPPLSIGTQLASYVWDLQFRTAATLQNPGWPSPTPTPTYPSTNTRLDLPAYVEIRFKALSAGAARQLEGNTSIQRSTWNDANSNSAVYQNIILPGTRQFVVRVPINSGSITSTP